MIKNKTKIILLIIFLISACKFTGDNNNLKINLDSIDSIKAVVMKDNLPYEEDLSYQDTFYYSQQVTILDSFELEEWDIAKNPQGAYNQIKNTVKTKKQEFSLAYANANDSTKEIIIKQAKNYIYETLLNKIIPHWYGMPWNMSGYSAIPQEGTVGCSYFVSNTLLHAGFNLNRYRIAQADATTIARSIQTDNNLIELYNKTPDDLIKYVKNNLKEGLYIVGLECHVGYILYRKNEVFFIHSNYFFPVEIVIEKAIDSPALVSSIYVIGKITTNKQTIIKWLTNSKFKVLSL